MNRNIVIVVVAACLGPWLGFSALCRSAAQATGVQGAAARGAAHGGLGLAADVNEDSLRAMVRFLSTNLAADSTRFVLRESSIATIADSLAARLGRYTGEPVERFPFSVRDKRFGPDSTYRAVNLVARLPGTGGLPGAILVTAHYDCISSRTPGWSSAWQHLPSPGADDNASGVAAVMEAARVLRSAHLPFGVTFILFSGEELGLLGSKYLVDSVVVNGAFLGDRILAVLNSDMIGYPRSPGSTTSGCVISTYDSSWLSDMIIRSASEVSGVALTLFDPGPSDYDHASFWLENIPAVSFTEPLLESGAIANSHYHTLGDTLGTLDFDQALLLTRSLVGFIEGLGEEAAEITMTSSDLFLVTTLGQITGRRSFSVGDTLDVRARVRNIGVEDPPPGASVSLTIALQNGAGSRNLYTGSVSAPAALSASVIDVPLLITRELAGEDGITASIKVAGMPDDPANDGGELDFAVEGPNPAVLMQAFEPNPITGSFSAARFCVNLAQAIPLRMEIFTLEGERVATTSASVWGILHTGLNCLPCSQLFPGKNRLASGVYVYRLIASPAGANQIVSIGRFAVQN